MPVPEAAAARPRGAFRAFTAAFFVFLYTYIWQVVDVRLLYHRQDPVFFLERGVLKGCLGSPGGLGEYAGAVLLQGCYVGGLGAFALAALAALASLGTFLILRRCGTPGARWFSFVPAALLLALYSQYDAPLATPVGLVAALLVSSVYGWLPVSAAPLRLAAFFLLGLALYGAVGGPFLVYVVLAAMLELMTPRRRWLGAACLLLGAAVPYVAATSRLFDMELGPAYGRLLRPQGSGVAQAAWIALHAFPLFGAALGALLGRPGTRPASAPAGTAPAAASSAEGLGTPDRRVRRGKPGLAARFRESRLGRLPAPLGVIALTAALAWVSFDGETRRLLAVDYYTQHGAWEDALREAQGVDRPNPCVQEDVMRALFHAGRLPYDMFRYPVVGRVEPPASLASFYRHRHYLKMGEILFLVGRVNTCEHLMYEALELVGETPPILRRLAQIHLLKGEPAAARVFLCRLQESPWDRTWARQWRECLDAGSDPPDGGELEHLRAFLYRTDNVETASVEQILREALETDRRNRAAFELMMAHFLLAVRPDEVAAQIGRLDDFGYSDIPVLYEEALLHYANVTGRPLPDLGTRRIRAETIERFRGFLSALGRHKADRQEAWDALKADYGSTYWFYATFGRTPFGDKSPQAPSKPPGPEEAVP